MLCLCLLLRGHSDATERIEVSDSHALWPLLLWCNEAHARWLPDLRLPERLECLLLRDSGLLHPGSAAHLRTLVLCVRLRLLHLWRELLEEWLLLGHLWRLCHLRLRGGVNDWLLWDFLFAVVLPAVRNGATSEGLVRGNTVWISPLLHFVFHADEFRKAFEIVCCRARIIGW